MRIWLSDGDRRLQDENGYGRISAALVEGLTALGHEIQFKQFKGMDLALFVCPPGRIKMGRPVPSVALAMHELDYLPAEKHDWSEILNKLDLVITPTEWNRQMWLSEGVRTPIDVVPLGVDCEAFFPVGGRTCTFLSVHENLGGTSSRENWHQTLRAYCAAFTAADDVRLLVKTWKWKPDEWQAALERTLLDLDLQESAPAIEVIDERLSTEEMRALYQSAWLFVKNANREGWSLPCTEAVACGATVAATRIEPLVSHLPEDTRWLEVGDADGLRRLLRAEYARFCARRRRSERYGANVMTRLVESALVRTLELDRRPEVGDRAPAFAGQSLTDNASVEARRDG
jgi:glycosyltransferase involved in cell wall biosynthesis